MGNSCFAPYVWTPCCRFSKQALQVMHEFDRVLTSIRAIKSKDELTSINQRNKNFKTALTEVCLKGWEQTSILNSCLKYRGPDFLLDIWIWIFGRPFAVFGFDAVWVEQCFGFAGPECCC